MQQHFKAMRVTVISKNLVIYVDVTVGIGTIYMVNANNATFNSS